jgi:hypothetical protein
VDERRSSHDTSKAFDTFDTIHIQLAHTIKHCSACRASSIAEGRKKQHLGQDFIAFTCY